MSDEQTTSPSQQLSAFTDNLRDIFSGAMRDYYAPLQGGDNLDDRSELIYDELWSALARALVIHAPPTILDKDPDAVTLEYIASVIQQKRHAAGLPPLGGRRVRVPVLGSVVADAEMGNRVEWAVGS